MRLPKSVIFDILDAIPQLWGIVEIKTQEMLYRQLRSEALELFRGGIDGNEFLTEFASDIEAQLTKAWNEGADESGVLPEDYTDEDNAELQSIIDAEIEYVYQLGDDIIELAKSGGTIEDFRTQIGSRLDIWANRYNEVANRARIYFGGKEKYIWKIGATEMHCDTCSRLDGIVAWAQEWDEAGVVPGQAGSEYLACGGWRCDCTLESVGRSKRRTSNALEKIMEIIGG